MPNKEKIEKYIRYYENKGCEMCGGRVTVRFEDDKVIEIECLDCGHEYWIEFK